MPKYKINIIIFIVLLFNTSNKAQEYLFDIQEINVKDGLPNRMVLDMIQDKKGFIWLSTPGALSRYDGDEFKTYPTSFLNISESATLNLAIDKNDNIWYCESTHKEKPGRGGVFNPKEEEVYTLEEYTKGQFTSEDILAINYSSINKEEWFLMTLKGVIYKYNGVFEKIYTLPENYFYKALFDQHPDGSYWIVNMDKIFHTKNQQLLETFDVEIKHLSRINKFEPNPIFQSHQGGINLWELKEGQLQPYAPVNFKPADMNGLIHEEDNYYIFAINNQIIVQDKQGEILFTYERADKIGSSDNIGFFKKIIDKQNNLWISTNNGIIKISHKKNNFSILKEGNSFRGIYMEDQKRWIGWGNNSFPETKKTGDGWDNVNSMPLVGFSKDEREHLWIGTTGRALVEYIPETEEHVAYKFEEFLHLYTPFYNRQTNKLWVGTDKGIVEFDRKKHTLTPYDFPIPTKGLEVRHFHLNERGIWLITSQGIFLMDPKQETILKHYTEADGLPHFNFNHLYEDAQGIFWLASKGGGLIRWDVEKNKFKQFTQNNGLSNNTIYAVYEDDFENLWLPSNYGLMRFDKNTSSTQVYLPQHGIAHEEFNTYSHFQAADGTLYFGGINGITTFHPKDLPENKEADIPIYITKVNVLSEEQDGFVDKTEAYIHNQEIILEPSDNILELGVSLLDYTQVAENQYAYQITGYQDQWVYTKDNKISIINLPYGKYQLNIKSRGASSSWSTTSLSIPINVKTPFYWQWWFILSGICLGLLSLFLLIKRREVGLQKDRDRLEEEVKKRTLTIAMQTEELKNLDKAKTRFFSNITHEFRTPLTLIIGPLEQYLNKPSLNNKQEKLPIVLKNAKHLLNLINQLLDLSKLEGGKMKVELMHGDLVAYTTELVERFQSLAEEKQITLSIQINLSAWETYFDKDKWDKIIYNLLSNAIKFTPKGGAIQISLYKNKRADKETIQLKIKDSGIGIAEEQLAQIFNRFHQIDDSSTRHEEGTGIGLALVKELIEIQEGEIQVESAINKGTTFTINLPVLDATYRVSTNTPIPLTNKESAPILVQETSNLAPPDKLQPTASQRLEILIIEDNPEMQQYIKSCISSDLYLVRLADNGAEGIEKAEAFIPDLIISDIMMPIKDGFEVVQQVKNNMATSHIPIILLTAKSSLESKLEGLKRGVDAYLTKPFSPEELSIRIEKLIEIRQQLQLRYTNNKLEQNLPLATIAQFEKEDNFITELRAFIVENLEEEQLNGDFIGKEFGMSRMQLHRKLKGLINQTTSEYIRSIRLTTAYQLLTKKQLNISEVAYSVGFKSSSHFSKVFKKQFGEKPSEV